jgi:mannose-6-phosphate isomerase-like protein (cupin superfamily)
MRQELDMLKRLAIVFALSSAADVLLAADDGSAPGLYKSAAELMATLAKSAETRSDQATAPIVNEDHYRINIVRRGQPGVAMAHASGPAKGSELHYIIDGAGTIVTGGTLVRKPGATAGGPGSSIIEGGETRRVTKGDVVFIPAGTPHWYKEVEGSITYLEVRFDVESKK